MFAKIKTAVDFIIRCYYEFKTFYLNYHYATQKAPQTAALFVHNFCKLIILLCQMQLLKQQTNRRQYELNDRAMHARSTI